MTDPFKPSPHVFRVKGLSVLGRAAKRLEEFERGEQQRALIVGLPCRCTEAGRDDSFPLGMIGAEFPAEPFKKKKRRKAKR
jgi:hypothetical protein